ncbi:MAG: FHA domain-containing protein [Lachnospiraceae bacterium]|nr:FHA domain-containing protein [Lachnospiraceae bacterium]
MALTECANGHLYDSDQYESCPYCQGGINRVEFGGNDSGVGKTVGIGTPDGAPITPEIGATVAPAGYRSQSAAAEDTGKTVAVLQKKLNVEPVVGWIVCIEGEEKGKDHRLFPKNNTIGRSEKMDICIKGDNAISRENHARLAYDVKHNAFHLIPAENTNGIYVNDEPVYVPTKLEAYDLIELGESKFMFVPFCSEKFNWKDGTGKEE